MNIKLSFAPVSQTPADLLAAWRDEHGLGGLTEAAFAPHVEQAWHDVHAEPTDRAHASKNAQRLAQGAGRLGWAGGPAARNVIGCANLGLCNLGCPSGAKQSALLAYYALRGTITVQHVSALSVFQASSAGVIGGAPSRRRSNSRHAASARMTSPVQKCPCTIAARSTVPRGNSPRCSIRT